MKHMKKFIILLFASLFLAGCNNSVERADRTVSLIQENVTSIVNELTEVQLAENNIQPEFESTLSAGEDDFSHFNNVDSPIAQNIKRRQDHLEKLGEYQVDLDKLAEELTNQVNKSPLPSDQLINHIGLLKGLSEEITVYIADYTTNIDTESIIYQSLANPETDYQAFSAVFDRVSTLHTTNNINLERILSYFEPINAQLINFKVFLANLQENN